MDRPLRRADLEEGTRVLEDPESQAEAGGPSEDSKGTVIQEQREAIDAAACPRPAWKRG